MSDHQLDFLLSWSRERASEVKNYVSGILRSLRGVLAEVDPISLPPPPPQNQSFAGFSYDNWDRFIDIARLMVPLASLFVSLRFLSFLVKKMNPTFADKNEARKRAMEILRVLQVDPLPELTDYEVCIAVSLVDLGALTATTWADVGGLEEETRGLRDSVILPFRVSAEARAHLPPSRLLRAPKGVLFYGPPGCGKTLLARATARAANARLLNLQVSNLVNMFYGESQKLAEAVFSLAHKLQPSIIFIDEIDSFLSSRSVQDHESTRMMKTQFMALWDGLLSEANARILVIGATNRPDDLDSAILRRLPYKVHIPLPNARQRLAILLIHLRNEPLSAAVTPDFLESIARRSEGFSGSDLFEVCREAALHALREWIKSTADAKEGEEDEEEFYVDANDVVGSGDHLLKRHPSGLSIAPEDFEYAYEKLRLHKPSGLPFTIDSIPVD